MAKFLYPENVQILRDGFKEYLANNYPYLKYPGTPWCDAFYPFRHNIGMDFFAIFVDDNSIEKGLELKKVHFIEKGRNSAMTYKTAFKRFKEFIDQKYGGINEFLKIYP